MRHLLNQTSGLADAGYPAVTAARPESATERVADLDTARPVSEPGREFHYFDPNYQVLARMVEVVTGKPFAAYLRERVLDPLGMYETFTAPTAAAGAAAAQLAQGHVLVFGVPVAREELDGLLAGSGGVVTTPADMSRWLTFQATGAGPDGERVLDPALIRLSHTPPAGVPGGYGMGWQVVEPPGGPQRIEHIGVLSTFSAVQALLPDSGYGFALLFNANSALADTAGLTAALAELLATGATDVDVPSTRTTALLLAVLTVAALALRVGNLARLGRWARRRRGRRRWSLTPGLVWTVLPAALLVAVPDLLLAGIGRSFTYWQLALAMPDVMVFLGVAGVAGVAVAAARVVVLARLLSRGDSGRRHRRLRRDLGRDGELGAEPSG